MGLVIEETEVAYLKSFPCIVVKKTFQVTCRVASFQIQKMKLILFCRVPASSRRSQILMTLQFAPLIDVGWSRGSSSRYKVRSFGRIRIRICNPRSHRSRCMKGAEF